MSTNKKEAVAFSENVKPVFTHEWSFGYDQDKSFINLTTGFYNIVGVVTANSLILYDYEYETMCPLEGHINSIKQISVDDNGRWLATLDEGPNNRLIVWDFVKGLPIKIIYVNNKNSGKLVMSPTGKYLILTFNDQPQRLNLYIWATELVKPWATIAFDEKIDHIIDLCFSRRCEEYMVVTTTKYVIFLAYNKETKEIDYHNPKRGRHWPKMLLEYTCSVYNEELNMCYSTTINGGLAIWGDESILETLPNKKHGSIIEVQKKSPFTNELNGKLYLKFHNCKIISMRFIDDCLIFLDEKSILFCYNTFFECIYEFDQFAEEGIIEFQMNFKTRNLMHPGEVKSLISETSFLNSFRHNGKKEDVYKWGSVVNMLNESKEEIINVRDLLFRTKKNNIQYLNIVEKKVFPVFINAIEDAIAIDANPNEDYLCIGCLSGNVHLIDINAKMRVTYQNLTACGSTNVSVTCLKFSPNGTLIACGLSDGTLCLLHPTTLKPIPDKSARKSETSITMIEFCQQSMYLAYAESNFHIGLIQCNKIFHFVGLYKAHFEPITGIIFSTWKSVTKLFSISEDRHLNEYEIEECVQAEELVKSRRINIELEAIPLALVLSPACSKWLIISMDNFQFRTLDTDTMVLQDICRAPALTFPIHKLMDLNYGNLSSDKYSLFASGTKIGVMKGPIDGNPFKWMTYRAGISRVTGVCSTKDGLNAFTIAHKQHYVKMWSINIDVLDLLEKLGGEGITPFYSLFKYGKRNTVFKVLEELFFVALFLHHGIYNTNEINLNINREIPLCEVANILRAMGIFLTNSEMENVLNTLSFKSGQLSEQNVSFDKITQLFLSLQQENDFSYNKIKDAFETICSFKSDLYNNGKLLIKKEDFIKCLEQEGECFTELELYNLFIVLTAHKEGDIYFSNRYFDESDYNFLPQKISFNYFLEKLLGFPVQTHDKHESLGDELNIYSGEPNCLKERPEICDNKLKV